MLSHVQLLATPWTVAHQAPLSMGLSRQEYWSGLPFPSPGDLPNPGIEPGSPALQVISLPSEPPGKPRHYTRVWCNFPQELRNFALEPQVLRNFALESVKIIARRLLVRVGWSLKLE